MHRLSPSAGGLWSFPGEYGGYGTEEAVVPHCCHFLAQSNNLSSWALTQRRFFRCKRQHDAALLIDDRSCCCPEHQPSTSCCQHTCSRQPDRSLEGLHVPAGNARCRQRRGASLITRALRRPPHLLQVCVVTQHRMDWDRQGIGRRTASTGLSVLTHSTTRERDLCCVVYVMLAASLLCCDLHAHLREGGR